MESFDPQRLVKAFDNVERVLATIVSSITQGGRTWELRIGSPTPAASAQAESADRPQISFSTEVAVPLATLARHLLPDEAAIARIEAGVAGGRSLEDAIRDVQPAFDDWSAQQRQAYCLFLKQRLDERDELPAA